jgi:hypothetical protein
MPFAGVRWSPGCSKCWMTPDTCKRSDRETQNVAEISEDVVV